MATAQPASTSDDPFRVLESRFMTPSPEFSPVPLWWWSGDPLDPARLRWQLERFVEGGVFNLVVINLAPTGPLYGNPADAPPFMSEAWWTIFRGVCADARELGVRLWFYDQIGFSGANIQGRILGEHPDFAGQTIERVTTIVKGAGEVACPPNGLPLAASWTPLDRYDDVAGASRDAPIVEGVARVEETSRGRPSLHYTAARGFDYLNPAACAALIDAIHGEFNRRAAEYIGDVIVGSFQDELPAMPRWSTTFAAAFQDQHGYDIVPLLDALWDDHGDESRRVRRDYHTTRAALGEAAFFRPLFDWHDSRGLTIGVDQQSPARTGAPSGTVDTYADYFRTHRWFSAPGSDHHGEAKIHSSIAHLYDRPRVWIESFHSSGWGGTIEETFDWLLPWLRAGATLYDPHASYYSTRGGWFEWAPPSTDWRQPYWRHYRHFADAVSRLCGALSLGDHVCDVGVLFPTTTVQSGVGMNDVLPDAQAAHDITVALIGRMVWYDQQVGVLDETTIDYDLLDDDAFARATVDGGRLRIGRESYRTIVLPGTTVLEPAVAARLVEFVDSGGRLVAIGHLPNRATTPGGAGAVAALRERFANGQAQRVASAAAVANVLGDGVPLVDAPVPTLVRTVADATLVFVPAAFPAASKVLGHRGPVDFDRGRYQESMTIRVRGVRGGPELWDPFTGERHALAGWTDVDGGVEVVVPFNRGPGALVVFAGETSTAPPVSDSVAETRVVAELNDGWTAVLEPTLDNRWGDFTWPRADGPFPLERWTVEHRRDGDETWTRTVATFGPRALTLGPVPADEIEAIAPDDQRWTPAAWSLSRGIHKDPIHAREPIGPSGHVPQEFLHFGQLTEGEALRVRTTLLVPDVVEGWLVIGAAAAKRIRIDGEPVAIDPGEAANYGTFVPLTLTKGPLDLDLTLAAEVDGVVRVSFAVTTDDATFRRPERIAAVGEPVAETVVRFAKTIDITSAVSSATIQVAANAPCRILIDGAEIGRQGGFMPYGDYHSIHPYDISPQLPVGPHEIALELQDLGRDVVAMVDGVIATAEDEEWLVTDATWSVARDGDPVGVRIERGQRNDPAIAHLRRRPHPLPASSWLEGPGADDGSVARIVPSLPDATGVEWIRFDLPPGATRVSIPVVGQVTASDGRHEIGFRASKPEPWVLDVRGKRGVLLRVRTEPGYAGGAALTGPVTYTVDEGPILLGTWESVGLTDYSGAVRYRRQLTVPETTGRVTLDLGDLRGTAEVLIDGATVGTRVLGPWRFDLTDALAGKTGDAQLEIVVTNTLGPYLDAVSPTPFVAERQRVSGLFGPVRLLVG